MSTRQLSPKRRDRSYRVEIPKAVKLEVFRRAGGPEELVCEGECCLPLRGKPFEYHHLREEWTWNLPKSQRPPITAADVKLLCIPCHDNVSAVGTKDRSHSKRIIEKTARAKKTRNPLPGSKASGWRKKMDGSWERR